MAPRPEITPALSKGVLPGTFPGELGIELVDIDDERVVGRLEVTRRHLHPGGYVHGGVWVAFGDTVAAWGTMRHVPPDDGFTTLELKTNVFARAKDGDVLNGVGRPIHIGGRTQVWEVRISRGDRPAAFFTCTQIVLPGTPDDHE